VAVVLEAEDCDHLAISDDAIASIVRFADPAMFARFGLPTTLEG